MTCSKQKDRWGLLLLLTLFISLTGISVYADDIEAQAELKKAKQAFADEDYYDAGKAYRAAELYADSPDIKFLALTKAAEAFDKADKKYKQFQCYKDMIAGFPDRINFAEIIDKEYEIGNAFHNGHRDIPLSWLPWIKDSNKAPEIYKTVLEQAPFAKFAPALKLRLGRIYLEEEKNEKALRMFRQIIKQHPKTPEEKYARFELANALVQLSQKAGDGDGAYAREAEAVLKETLKIYPKDPETLWLNQSVRETDDVRSERLFKLAEFYQSRENPEAAKRYFNDLISRFPESKYVAASEKHLKELDENYTPKAEKKKRKRLNLYPVIDMPSERNVILVAPEASGGKWLLPIEDLDLDSAHADEDYAAEKAAKEEAARKAKAKREAELAARKAARKKLEAEQLRKKKEAEALQKKRELEKEAELKEKARKQAKKLQAAAEAARTKAEEAKRKKAAAEKKAKENNNKNAKKDKPEASVKANPSENIPPVKIKSNASDSKSSIWTYMIPLILILMILAAILILYLKKKK